MKAKANTKKPKARPEKKLIRLNKFLAERGGLSRRKAERLIKQGEVFVNGKKISGGAGLIDPAKSSVRIKKQPLLKARADFVYFMLNKPEKVLSSSHDPKGRPTALSYIKKRKERLFLVGRLDWDSEGLLLLTNDGAFANQALRPKVAKSYLVKVKGWPSEAKIKKLKRGVSSPKGRLKAIFAKKLAKKTAGASWLKIILAEGKNRQIRLMLQAIGHPVRKLRRTAIGRLKMNKLAKGAYVQLSCKDIKKVFQQPKELKV